MNPARSVGVMRGHGPWSKALRAASTARLTSASCASATVKNSSSVAELITRIFAVLDGSIHFPSMKSFSGCLTGLSAFMSMLLNVN